MKRPTTIKPPLHFLYTDIGRGHPFYLDGILDEIERRGDGRSTYERRSVFGVSKGLSALAWRSVRYSYRKGSSGGVLGKLYAAVRRHNDYTRTGMIGMLLGRDIVRLAREQAALVVVAHPLLVGLLRKHARVIYQHGELVAPEEALVPGAEMVIVPTDGIAQMFRTAGYSSEQVFVSGLCIEPGIATQAKLCFEQRLKRLRGGEPLTGLLLSSGAEPTQHVRQIISSGVSCVEGNVRCIVLARAHGRLEHAIKKDWTARGLIYHALTSDGLWPKELGRAALATFRSRKEENELAARIFPEVDFLVVPPHERSNWAIGLGLPTFLLTPAVGPFAPLNQELLLGAGVARRIDAEGDASLSAGKLAGLRNSGQLVEMAERGWGRPIDGFARIADMLVERFG